MALNIVYYDGQVGRRRLPRLEMRPDGFTLEDEWGIDGPIPWAALVARERSGATAIYGHRDRPGWQIILTGEFPPELAAHLPPPERYGRWIDRHGIVRASAVMAVLAGLALFVFLSAPRWIAPLIPMSWERRLGDAIVGDFGGRFCNGPGGQAALDALARKLAPNDSGDIEVRVANISMVNAVALPGGKIVIFKGLLAEAGSAEEVAGILGHEIGHVRNRDVLTALLRQAGFSVLLGGMDGNLGGAFNALLSATYSRDAEAKADIHSIASLNRARIATRATADFFRRRAADEEKLGDARVALSYLSSHPMSDTRERRFLTGTPKGAQTVAALDAAQWNALINICRNDPKMTKEDSLFGF